MHKMSEAKIARGEKWSRILAENEFRGQTIPEHLDEVKWMKSQPSIVSDIEFYKKSLEPVKETKVKEKK